MSITVRYFASLKEQVGCAEQSINLETATAVKAVWRQLNPNVDLSANILAAVNQEYVTLDYLVNEGDELAFFPPVTGG